jgi:beta-carotene ketolase (CrtW type)
MKYPGLWIGIAIILLWSAVLAFNFQYDVEYGSLWTYLLMLLQAHLFTGLFITAHDAMHGTVAPGNKGLNHAIGRLCALLFIFNSYNKLLPKHHEHHRHAGTYEDPDYHRGNANFFVWFIHFAREYVTIWQIVAAAITYNLLALVIPKENLILFWIIPSFLSMFQLFFFGTYLPHRGEHAPDNKHRARSQRKNHLWAFLSCYFFGYHYEHHDAPWTPWWKLWQQV